MKSITSVMGPIIAALVKAEEILGVNREWKALDEIQKAFLKYFFTKRDMLGKFKPDELRSWVSDKASELNAILAKEGFTIQLDEFDTSRNEFGVVSILDVLVEWLKEGKKIKINHQGVDYPGVSMEKKALSDEGSLLLFDSFTSLLTQNPIACVHTKTGDRVFMTLAPSDITEGNLVEVIEKIRLGELYPASYDLLEFPMIDYNQEIDISWLLGMWTNDNKDEAWMISQALQQTKFKMNHKGAHVKSAVAIGTLRCVSFPKEKKTLRIDKPFLLWIERDGLSIPIKYAYYDVCDWKDPGSLDM